MSGLYSAAQEYFSSRSDLISWFIPVVVRISNDLRVIAQLVSHRDA